MLGDEGYKRRGFVDGGNVDFVRFRSPFFALWLTGTP